MRCVRVCACAFDTYEVLKDMVYYDVNDVTICMSVCMSVYVCVWVYDCVSLYFKNTQTFAHTYIHVSTNMQKCMSFVPSSLNVRHCICIDTRCI